MESSRLNTIGAQAPKSSTEFTGSSVREGDRKGAPWIMCSRQDAISDAVRDCPSFAGSSPRQNHDRPLKALGDSALLIVESLEDSRRIHEAMLS